MLSELDIWSPPHSPRQRPRPEDDRNNETEHSHLEIPPATDSWLLACQQAATPKDNATRSLCLTTNYQPPSVEDDLNEPATKVAPSHLNQQPPEYSVDTNNNEHLQPILTESSNAAPSASASISQDSLPPYHGEVIANQQLAVSHYEATREATSNQREHIPAPKLAYLPRGTPNDAEPNAQGYGQGQDIEEAAQDPAIVPQNQRASQPPSVGAIFCWLLLFPATLVLASIIIYRASK